MNVTFLLLDEQRELNASYLEEIALSNDKTILLEDKNNTCEEKVVNLVVISEEKDKQLKILTSENKKQQKKIKFLKKMRNLYGIGGVVIGGVGGYLLSQILK